MGTSYSTRYGISFLFCLAFFLYSCKSETDDTDEDVQIESETVAVDSSTIVEYFSLVRPDSTHWDLSKTYVDTMEFVYSNTDADYWFAVFRKSDMTHLSFVLNETIDPELSGSILAVEWELDTLYEAGEGDEPYLDEILISYEIIEQKDGFEEYLREFLNGFSSQGDAPFYDRNVNKDVGFYTSWNPGAACWASESENISQKPNLPLDLLISDQLPEGGFCEGYEGAKDGFYYEKIAEDKLPEYLFINEDGDEEFRPPLLQSHHRPGPFRKVTWIQDEFHVAYLYFIRADGAWYVWIYDSCDCSA